MGDEEEGNIEKPEGPGKLTLITLFFLFLVIPTVVFTVRGFVDRGDCDDVLDENLKDCTSTFADNTRTFQSQFKAERDCIAMSHTLANECRGRSNTLIFGGALCLFGFLCSSFLIYALEGVLTRFGAQDALAGAHNPRAVYHEPTSTEDERRKAQMRASGVKEKFGKAC